MTYDALETARKTTALLVRQFRFNQYALGVNTREVTQQQSLMQPAPGGNCLNWVVGHIVAVRHEMLHAALGLAPTWTSEYVERYKRASKPVTAPGEAADLSGILEAYAASQELAMPALADLGWDGLDEPTKISPGNDPKETLGSLVAGLAFHEAYHVGQTGTIRRLIGLDGILT